MHIAVFWAVYNAVVKRMNLISQANGEKKKNVCKFMPPGREEIYHEKVR